MIAVYVVLALLVVGMLGVALILLTHVEDWGRDLSTNVAATNEGAKDERLRPLHSLLPPAQLAALVIESARAIPRWELVEQSDKPAAQARDDQDATHLHFVRTTGLMRFKDDIRVRIEPNGAGSLLTAESRSRVGKGDLGQNPRNLRELLDKVRAGGG